MQTAKTVVGTIGSFASAAFLGAGGMLYFSASSHPRVLFWIVVASAVLCVLCVALWLVFNSLAPTITKTTPSLATATIGGGNSGTQMSAGRDIVQHHYHVATPAKAETTPPTATAPPIPDTPPAPAKVAPSDPPALLIKRGFEDVIFDYMQSAWRTAFAHEGGSIRALVIWVENPYPRSGSGKNRSLVASIRAEQFESVSVARGYWTGQRFNEVALQAGAELGIIVGFFDGNNFIVFDNPSAPTTGYNILEDGFRSLGHKARLPLVISQGQENAPLRITVKIVQMPGQYVIACKVITVTLPQRIVAMHDCDDARKDGK